MAATGKVWEVGNDGEDLCPGLVVSAVSALVLCVGPKDEARL
jgi:hypothetical protein